MTQVKIILILEDFTFPSENEIEKKLLEQTNEQSMILQINFLI